MYVYVCVYIPYNNNFNNNNNKNNNKKIPSGFTDLAIGAIKLPIFSPSACVCVCVCVCVCACVCVCKYICIYKKYLYLYLSIYISIYLSIYMHMPKAKTISISACMYICVSVYLSKYAYAQGHVRKKIPFSRLIHTHLHKCTNTLWHITHAYVFIYTCTWPYAHAQGHVRSYIHIFFFCGNVRGSYIKILHIMYTHTLSHATNTQTH